MIYMYSLSSATASYTMTFKWWANIKRIYDEIIFFFWNFIQSRFTGLKHNFSSSFISQQFRMPWDESLMPLLFSLSMSFSSLTLYVPPCPSVRFLSVFRLAELPGFILVTIVWQKRDRSFEALKSTRAKKNSYCRYHFRIPFHLLHSFWPHCIRIFSVHFYFVWMHILLQ